MATGNSLATELNQNTLALDLHMSQMKQEHLLQVFYSNTLLYYLNTRMLRKI